MSQKYNDATRNRPEGERIIDAPTVFADLNSFIRQIRSEDAWSKNDRNSITIFKANDLRVVLGGLHQGAEMLPHKAEGMMSIHVLEGNLEVNTDDLTTNVEKGQLVAIHKDNNYRVVAVEESIYLLTMSNVK
ncbi:MAG: hypothetical protein V4649_02490 [Bacteroidota bacterium]